MLPKGGTIKRIMDPIQLKTNPEEEKKEMCLSSPAW